MLRHQYRLGFTLIELLVVISIMAILMGMAAVSFTTAQVRGRDAKRRADMSGIQKGFEQYYAQNSAYESSAGPTSCTTMGNSTTYFPAGLPLDPKNASPYTYAYSCTPSTYCACARLESGNVGNSTSSSCVFANSGATIYYCISNLQ